MSNIDQETFQNRSNNLIAFQQTVASTVDGLDEGDVLVQLVEATGTNRRYLRSKEEKVIQAVAQIDVDYTIVYIMEEIGYSSEDFSIQYILSSLQTAVDTGDSDSTLASIADSLDASPALLNVTSGSVQLLSTLVQYTRSTMPSIAPTALPGASNTRADKAAFVNWAVGVKVVVIFIVISIGLLLGYIGGVYFLRRDLFGYYGASKKNEDNKM